MSDMKLSVSKCDLWVALDMCPDKYKTDFIKELEKNLDSSMSKPGRVVITIRED